MTKSRKTRCKKMQDQKQETRKEKNLVIIEFLNNKDQKKRNQRRSN